jgi:hypothetical protein
MLPKGVGLRNCDWLVCDNRVASRFHIELPAGAPPRGRGHELLCASLALPVPACHALVCSHNHQSNFKLKNCPCVCGNHLGTLFFSLCIWLHTKSASVRRITIWMT